MVCYGKTEGDPVMVKRRVNLLMVKQVEGEPTYGKTGGG